MNRTTKQPPEWEHQIHFQSGLCEDLYFGTYWVLDAHNRPTQGPYNTVAEAQRVRDNRVDVV